MLSAVVSYVMVSYATAYVAKTAGVKKKWLPVVSAITGMLCGVYGYFITNISNDLLDSVALGLFSGFSAVGTNEITKYLFVRKE